MNRTLAPAFQTSVDFKLPKPEKTTSKSGSPIIYLPYTQTPVAKIEFVFTAGKIHDRQPGLAQFTVNLLDKGTSSRSANQIAELLDYHGAHLELAVDSDFASISLYCLSRHLDTLLPLVIEIVTEPTFPEDELRTYRNIFIENLKVNQKKNSYLASITLRKTLFNNHPYGWSTEQTDAEQTTTLGLQKFFKDNYNLKGIFITGSVSKSIQNQLCDFGSKSGSKNTVSSPGTSSNISSQVINGPGKDQASIRFGKISPNRKSDNFANLVLLNHLFGGFFGSRLMKNIREEKGLTYGIYSSIQHFQLASILTIGAEVNIQNTSEAKEEIIAELSNLQKALPEEELQIAKNHLIGSLQNDNASVFSVSERLKTIELFDLQDNHYEHLINSISKCSVNDLIEVGKKEFLPETFSCIVVN